MSSTIPEPQEVQSAMHVCDIPDCETTKPFKRKADLQRHHEQRHQTQEQKKRFDCDYSKCDRHQTPFHRMDHFRDHYRDFHKEELPRKRGESDEWYAEKAKTASKRWWRCVKCLNRVYIKESGFDCSCGSTCDKPRRQLRGFAA